MAASVVLDGGEVHEFLQSIGLPKYAPTLLERGFNRMEGLMSMTEADMRYTCGMPLGHVRKLQRALEELAATTGAAPAVAGRKMRPMSAVERAAARELIDFIVDAKLTVMSPKQVERLCTIVEIQGDRVKVHYDGFDTFHDEWLPKDSQRIVDQPDAPGKVNVVPPAGIVPLAEPRLSHDPVVEAAMRAASATNTPHVLAAVDVAREPGQPRSYSSLLAEKLKRSALEEMDPERQARAAAPGAAVPAQPSAVTLPSMVTPPNQAALPGAAPPPPAAAPPLPAAAPQPLGQALVWQTAPSASPPAAPAEEPDSRRGTDSSAIAQMLKRATSTLTAAAATASVPVVPAAARGRNSGDFPEPAAAPPPAQPQPAAPVEEPPAPEQAPSAAALEATAGGPRDAAAPAASSGAGRRRDDRRDGASGRRGGGSASPRRRSRSRARRRRSSGRGRSRSRRRSRNRSPPRRGGESPAPKRGGDRSSRWGEPAAQGRPAEEAALAAGASESKEDAKTRSGVLAVPVGAHQAAGFSTPSAVPPAVQPKVITGANGGFKRIPVPSSLIKPLLGHGGAHITAIRRQNPFANIKVDHTPGSDSGALTITGRPDHVTQAEQAIWQTLAKTAPAQALIPMGITPAPQ